MSTAAESPRPFFPLASLRDRATTRPDELVVVGSDLRMGAKELWDSARRVVGWLRLLGVADDEIVAVARSSDADPILAVALIVRGGPTAAFAPGVTVGPDALVQRVIAAEQLEGVPPGALILFDEVARRALAVIDPEAVRYSEPTAESVVRIAFAPRAGSLAPIPMTAARIETLLGRPHGVGFGDDRTASLLPISTVGGLLELLSALGRQQPFILFAQPGDALPYLLEERIELIDGTPDGLAGLLDAARAAGERLPWLRTIIAVDDPIAPSLARELSNWFGTRVYSEVVSVETGEPTYRRVDDMSEPHGQHEAAAAADPVQTIDAPAEQEIVVEPAPAPQSPLQAEPALQPEPRAQAEPPAKPEPPVEPPVEAEAASTEKEETISGHRLVLRRADELIAAVDGVREAATAIVTDSRGKRHLGLAIVGEPEDDLETFSIRVTKRLKGVTPALLITLKKLPRTGDGVLDREAVRKQLQQRFDADDFAAL